MPNQRRMMAVILLRTDAMFNNPNTSNICLLSFFSNCNSRVDNLVVQVHQASKKKVKWDLLLSELALRIKLWKMTKILSKCLNVYTFILKANSLNSETSLFFSNYEWKQEFVRNRLLKKGSQEHPQSNEFDNTICRLSIDKTVCS